MPARASKRQASKQNPPRFGRGVSRPGFLFANINGQNVRLGFRQLKGEIRWSTGAGNALVGGGTPKSRTKDVPNFWTLQLRVWLHTPAPNNLRLIITVAVSDVEVP